MSFGLGYYENGIWVDHSGSAEEDASQPSDVGLDAVHQWYGCCTGSTAAQSSVIADETDVRALPITRADRPSASVLTLMPLAPVRAIEK